MTTYGVAALDLFRNGYEPIPVEGKAPVIPDWSKLTLDEAKVTNYGERFASHSVGIRHQGGLDFDIYDEALAAHMLEYVKSRLTGVVLVRYGQRPKFLIPCRLAEGVKNKCHSVGVYTGKEEGKTASKIEVSGRGSQFVAFGIHPGTGRPYEWEGGDLLGTPAADLPEVGPTLLSEIFAEFSRRSQETGHDVAIPMNQPEAGRPSVNGRALDPRQPGDDFIRQTNLLDLVLSYGWQDTGTESTRIQYDTGPDGEPQSFQIKQRYVIRPGKGDGGDLNYQHSGNVARVRGVESMYVYTTSIPELEANRSYNAFQFYTYMEHNGDFYAAARALRREGYGGTSPEDDFSDLATRDRLACYNERYVLIGSGKLVADMEYPDHEPMAFPDFEYLNGHERTGPALNAPTIAKVWSKNPEAKRAGKIIYYPKKVLLLPRTGELADNIGGVDFNIYRAPDWRRTEYRNLIEPAVKILELLFGDRESPEFRYMLGWLSHMLHRPWERPTVTPLLISVYHGTGRGFLEELIRTCMGPRNCSTTTIDDLVEGQYHNHIYGKIFCNIAEISSTAKGKFQINDKIRDILTNTRMTLNLKYGAKTECDIFARFLLSSNNRDCAVLPLEDRRIFVITCDQSPLPEAAYTEAYSLLEDPAWLDQWMSFTERFLHNYPWQHKGRAMMTDDKRALIDIGISDVERAFMDMLKDTDIPAVGTAIHIRTHLLHTLKGTRDEDNDADISESLEKQIASIIRKRTSPMIKRFRYEMFDGDNPRIRILRHPKKWRDVATREEIEHEMRKWGGLDFRQLALREKLGEDLFRMLM